MKSSLPLCLLLAVVFTLLGEAAPPFSPPDFALRVRIEQIESSNAPTNAAAPGWFLAGARGSVALSSHDWSQWIEITGDLKTEILTKRYPNLYLKRYPVVAAFTVHPHKVERMTLRVEWRVGEHTGSYAATYSDHNFAALLWRDEDGSFRVGPSSEYNRRYLAEAEKLNLTAENLPRQFVFVDRFIGVDSDQKAWDDGLRLLKLLGFNTIADAPKARVAREGIGRTAGAVYWPPLIHDADTNVTSRAAMDQWAQNIADGFRKAGWDPKEVVFFALADEPGWYYPAAFNGTWPTNDPAMRARMLGLFRDYLRAKGFTPSQFGARRWDQVEFLGRSGARDLPTKRRFYWTMRFFADNSAEVFARWTQALERAFYPGLPIACNWNFFAGRFYVPGPVANNADKQSPDAAMGGHDWIDFGRQRGVTALWTEDWFGDAMAPQWSFYMSKLRSAADHYNQRRKPSDPVPIGTGGYVIGATTGDKPGGCLQKILAVLGHGGKTIKFYVFGPEYAFPGNCWSENPIRMGEIARAMRVVGAAEDLLFPGRPLPAEVAMLTPQSAQLWDKKEERIATGISDATNTDLNRHTVDYMAEVFNLFTALQHANVPVDWVDEADLADPAWLRRFKVLYLTPPNLPPQAVSVLRRWVADGGVLVLTAGCGQADEYDEFSPSLERLTGIKTVRRQRLYSPAHGKPQGDVVPLLEGHGSFVAHGFAQPLVPTAATVAARFKEGNHPAITLHRLGKGSVIVFGTLVGTAYNLGGQTEAARQWVTWPARLAGVRPPVEIGTAKIESPVLVSEAGLAVTLLNWSGAAATNLPVRVATSRPVRRVVSVLGGECSFEQADGAVRLSLPRLEQADVLKLYW